MKAVILVAGMGSRLGRLTETTPKSLLPIGRSTTLDRMLATLAAHDVDQLVLVCGHLQEAIERHLAGRFPGHTLTFVRNPDYATTNTAASLLLARAELEGESFVKLDGDVVFDPLIMTRLLSAADGCSYACVDRTAVDAEVIKVQCNGTGSVTRIGNDVPVASAVGESIGIERIDARSSAALFAQLALMGGDEAHRQSYYEVAYDAIVQAGEPFRIIEVTGLPWVETDSLADYELAQQLFGTTA